MPCGDAEHYRALRIAIVLGGADLAGESTGLVTVRGEVEFLTKSIGDGCPVRSQRRDLF